MREEEIAIYLRYYKTTKQPEIARHVDGINHYVIFGAETIDGVTGYTYLVMVLDDNVNHNHLGQGWIREEDRVTGLNGSGPNVNLKSNSVDTILLINAIPVTLFRVDTTTFTVDTTTITADKTTI